MSATNTAGLGETEQTPLKEQVSPYKLCLLVLINEFVNQDESKARTPTNVRMALFQSLNSTADDGSSRDWTEDEKRDFMITMIQLLQSPDLELLHLVDVVQKKIKASLCDSFRNRLQEFYEDGLHSIKDFFKSLSTMISNPTKLLIQRHSVVGVFIRALVLAHDKLSFSQEIQLYKIYCTFYEALDPSGEDSAELGGSLRDVNMDFTTGSLHRSHLHKSFDTQNVELQNQGQTLGHFYSIKQAEYFIAQQAFLLQHNESEAMAPAKLQDTIREMLVASPELAEAHFLSYLNSLRVKEYCTAIHNLFHYFDRLNRKSSQNVPANTKGKRDEYIRRYAALNLASLQYRFGHKRESLAALREAIQMSQVKSDHVCLEHCLSWLHRLGEQSAEQTTIADDSLEADRTSDLSYLSTLNIQALAKDKAIAGEKPATVFKMFLDLDEHWKHNRDQLICASRCQKAALWDMYGKRECSSLASQLALRINAFDNGIFYCGEATCIAMCNLAQHHFDKCLYSMSSEIINHCKRLFPSGTQYAYIWVTSEQEMIFDRALFNCRWGPAEQALVSLKAVNEDEANIRMARLMTEKGQMSEAFELLHKLRDKCKQNPKRYSPHYLCRLLLVFTELCSQTENSTEVINYATEAVTTADTYHLQYLASMATIHLAFIQRELPQQSLRLLDKHLPTILSDGRTVDQAKALYCYARCQVATTKQDSEPKKRRALSSSVQMMRTVIEHYRAAEAYLLLKDAVYYLARLYHELNCTAERNKCAYQFRQLDQLYPTHSPCCVNRM